MEERKKKGKKVGNNDFFILTLRLFFTLYNLLLLFSLKSFLFFNITFFKYKFKYVNILNIFLLCFSNFLQLFQIFLFIINESFMKR